MEQLDRLLATGERIDGSSLLNYIEAASSDLYVVPKYKTAFVNPFQEVPTLELMCNYFNGNGQPLNSSPDNLMFSARDKLHEKTGFSLEVMGELEFYIIGESTTLFPATDQRGYHEAPPFAKFRHVVEEAMMLLAEMGASIKYGHSEVGNFVSGNQVFEQYEIEFQPTLMEEAANQLILAKWILRNLGLKYGLSVSFAPKITVGKAGSGLHIHSRLMKDGKNVMTENGHLSPIAKKAIAGLLQLAPSLTAFGNTIPTSYLRLVPHQEAPTNICWGDRNRSVLVRVPLGWLGDANKMALKLNPGNGDQIPDTSDKQTIELRCPDGSANIHLLFAGMAVAFRHGLEMQDALEYAEDTYVDVDIFKEKNSRLLKKLKHLPESCFESAENLLRQSYIYTQYDVFSQRTIEEHARYLKSFQDKGLSEKLFGKHDEVRALVNKYIHCS